MMGLKHNNRGFTLVELIVSTAILGIIALSASAFMVAGARTYNSVNYTVRLQYEAQLAMAQLQEYTVDCNSGIAWDSSTKTLYIVNGSTVHLFQHNATDHTLSYGTATKMQTLSASANKLVAEHVTGMDVVLEQGRASITLNMQRNNKTYNATQLIALRNQPATATSAEGETEDAWTKLYGKI